LRTGSVNEFSTSGSLPDSESTSLGRGRNPYLDAGEASAATKRVAEWVFTSKEDHAYWRQQAERQRERAGLPKSLRPADPASRAAMRLATRELADHVRDEMTQNIPPQLKGVYRDVLLEGLKSVNWREIAEDLLRE
jgi:hypothetical protein